MNRTYKANIKSYKDKQKDLEKKAELEQVKSSHFEEKYSQAKIKINDSEREKQNLVDYVNKLKTENKEFIESIEYCESLLNDNSEFSLYNDKGNITNQAEICIMKLLSAKVGINHIGDVLKAVFVMSGKEINKVPDEKNSKKY